MTIEEAVTAVLSAMVSSRVYPNTIPIDAALPAIGTTRESGGGAILTHQGRSGLVRANLRVVVRAATYEEAAALHRTIREMLDGYRGWMGGGNGVHVDHCRVSGEVDVFDLELNLIGRAMSLSILYRE